MSTEERIPVICIHPSCVPALTLFNPNIWSNPASRGVIQACATELAGLHYTTDQIVILCNTAKTACVPHFETLKRSWGTDPIDPSRLAFFGQVPSLHVHSRAFFAGTKSLLDLIADLLSTEEVVGGAIHGFHRVKGVYGGAVINALDRNVKKGRAQVAAAIKALLIQQKAGWIDDLIQFRDLLTHPLRGAQQLMFGLQVELRDGKLVYVDATPPQIGNQPIATYAVERLADATALSSNLLAALLRARTP